MFSFRSNRYWTVLAITAGLLAVLTGLFQPTIAADKKSPSAPTGMVFVEGGSFQMGDLFGDGKSWQPETPVHEVVVDSFYIARHEVTFGQFREFADATGYRTSAEKREGAYSQSPFETHWKLLGYKQAGDEPRILRGGCTGADAKGARVSSRACFGRADHCGNSGFRLARTAPVSGSPSVKTGAVRS